MWRGERCLFHELSLAVHAGRALHVRGPNGAGKTTLLRILCGLLTPDEGGLRLDGEPVRGADPRLRARVGYLGHADGLKHELRVLENLRFAASLCAGAPAGDPEALLDRMGLAGLARLETRLLSAGQRRRLALARLILGAHALWLLDEPFTALDSDGVALLVARMDEALGQGTAIVLTSHQPVAVAPARLDTLELGT